MFGFVRCDGCDGLVQTDVVARRSRYRVDCDPYPGSQYKIRQDSCPPVHATTHMDVALGASSRLCVNRGLAVPILAQEGDPLFQVQPHSCG